LPRDYAAATGQIPIGRMVFVEANCRADEAGREVEFVERLVRAEPRVAGIVAFVDLAQGIGTRGSGLGKTLDALSRSPRVKGMRQNIQGQPAGFCRQNPAGCPWIFCRMPFTLGERDSASSVFPSPDPRVPIP